MIPCIPDDVIKIIFSYCPPSDLVKVSVVCKKWHEQSKEIYYQQFQQMLEKTSALFCKMTEKALTDFNPEIQIQYSDMSFGKLAQKINSLVCNFDFYLDSNGCILSEISPYLAGCFNNKHKIAVTIGSFFVHIVVGKRRDDQHEGLNPKCVLYDDFCRLYHFPEELFAIKEEESTTFPFRGKIVNLRAKQLHSPRNEIGCGLFEKVIELRRNEICQSDNESTQASHLTYYLWQKDAYAKNYQSKEDEAS
jgi:hypothetical protein